MINPEHQLALKDKCDGILADMDAITRQLADLLPLLASPSDCPNVDVVAANVTLAAAALANASQQMRLARKILLPPVGPQPIKDPKP